MAFRNCEHVLERRAQTKSSAICIYPLFCWASRAHLARIANVIARTRVSCVAQNCRLLSAGLRGRILVLLPPVRGVALIVAARVTGKAGGSGIDTDVARGEPKAA